MRNPIRTCLLVIIALAPAGALACEAVGSAELTRLMSIHTIGVNLELGRGVSVDLEEAARWYLKAAELGYPDAQNDLAKLYDDGRGVARDNVRAYLWYLLAEEAGNPSAAQGRAGLRERMTAAEIAEAEQLARDWKGTQPNG
jgi:TPR repeat protein